MGLQAHAEEFDVDMATIEHASLTVDGVQIPCKGYLNAGSACVEAPLYCLRGKDTFSLSQCKDKIVLIDGYLGYWIYQDILENGALGSKAYCENEEALKNCVLNINLDMIGCTMGKFIACVTLRKSWTNTCDASAPATKTEP